MTLATIEGVSNAVFIPDDISQEDQNFLLERTENIAGIVTRAKIEIGLELLKVEQRFRNSSEFGGSKGWYIKWYQSIGITSSTKQTVVNAARLSLQHPDSVELIEGLPTFALKYLTTPSNKSGGTDTPFGGVCTELAEYALHSDDFRNSAEVVTSPVKSTAANQLLSGEQFVESLKSKIEDSSVAYKVRNLKDSLESAEAKLEALSDERAALEAKYEDWRSPEAIKQEFDEAISKARADEKAKKSTDTTFKDLHLQEVQKSQQLEEELAAIQAKLSDTIHTSDSFDTQLSNKEKEVKRLAAENKKLTQMVSGIRQEQNDPIDMGMVMTGIHCRVLVGIDDAKKFGQLSQYYNNAELKNKIEECAVDQIQAWLSVLSEMRVLAVTDSLN